MDEKYFQGQKVDAGFTTKELASDIRMASFLRAYPYVARARLVHGSRIEQVTKKSFRKDYYAVVPDCDGLITDVKNALLVTTHGDCIPVYAYDPVRKVCGLAHAGWRGTAAGIAAKLVQALEQAYGCRPADIQAAVGPGIGACCFEVESDVTDAFLEAYPWTEEYICEKGGGKFTVDLKAINAQLLENEGVEQITVSSHCTCCEPELFHSYRRDKTKERMLAYIALL